MITLGSLAGCPSLDEVSGPETTPTSELDGPQTPASTENGDVSFSVDPSATELDWGEEYSVTITAQAGEDPPDLMTFIVYQTGADTTWSGRFSDSEMM